MKASCSFGGDGGKGCPFNICINGFHKATAFRMAERASVHLSPGQAGLTRVFLGLQSSLWRNRQK